jgi:hypothetical protein
MTQLELIALVNEKLADYSNIVPSEHREVEIAIINAIFDNAPTTARMKYEVLEIDVNLTESPNFLADNFDSTGLGKLAYLGFAICNGQNGTKDRRGRVAVGYDSSEYPDLGAIGGAKDAVVVQHSHNLIKNDANSGGGNLDPTHAITDQTDRGNIDYDYWLVSAGSGEANVGKSETVGESGAGKNMQPYIVTLFIQKL